MSKLRKLSSIFAVLAVAAVSVLSSAGAANATEVGVSWENGTYASVPATAGMTSVAFGGGVFIGLNPTQVFRSTDGKNWSAISVPTPSVDWNAVAFGGNKFVLLGIDQVSGYTSFSISSDLGTTFSAPSPTGFTERYGVITFGNGKFVAAETGSSCSGATIVFDGQNWSAGGSVFDCGTGIAFGAGKFVATTDNGTIFYSSNSGTSWTSASFDTPPASGVDFSQVGFSGSRFLTLQYANSNLFIYTSTDGLNWTSQLSTGVTGSRQWGIGWDGSAWLAGAGRNKTGIFRSVDNGATWTLVNDNNTRWPAFALGNGIVVAGGISQSTSGSTGLDGITAVGWSVGPSTPTPNPPAPAPTPNTLPETGMDTASIQFTSAIATLMLAIGVAAVYAARRRNS